MLPSQDLRFHQCLSQFLEKKKYPLELPSLPLRVQCHPGDKGVVRQDVKNVKENRPWPAAFAAVGRHQLVYVVHPSFCGIIIHDDLWFLMLQATDSPIPVQCTHEYHILAFLWHI